MAEQRQKVVNCSLTQIGPAKEPGELERATFQADFDMDINLPVGGTSPLPANQNVTVTGPITVNTNLMFFVRYFSSTGTQTFVPGPVTVTPAGSIYQWNVTFLSPAAGNYTFVIDATHSATWIQITAPFTTANSQGGG